MLTPAGAPDRVPAPGAGERDGSAGDTAAGEFGALEELARVLTASREFRVIRRFRPPASYAERPAAGPTRVALFVDVETTGLSADADAVIEFAAVPFAYGVADGVVYDVGEAVVGLEDPGRPIPPDVTALTGITDEMVRGRRLDDAAVEVAVSRASLVIAHNAQFDRPFLEQRFPAFATKPWACSLREVPWERFGMRSQKLAWLLMHHCGEYEDDAHRADADCRAGVHLLATPLPCGTRPMQLLLASCRAPTARVWALHAPFAAKHALKQRGYWWSGGEDGRPRAWYADVPADLADAETRWLEAAVYGGAPGRWHVQRVHATERYSRRV